MKALRIDKKKFFVIVIIAVILSMFFSSVCLTYADNESVKKGSIEMVYAVPNAEFNLFYVADLEESGAIKIADKFSDLHIDIYDTKTLATTLSSYILDKQIKPEFTKKTGPDCRVKFTDLKRGIYMLTSPACIVDNKKYTATPVIVSVPQQIDSTTKWNVVVNGKYKEEKLGKTDISVCKLWEDNENPKRPDKIYVRLIKDGRDCDIVKLDKSNNWKYKWENLDNKNDWKVVENEIPDDYVVNIQQNGSEFIITNKLTSPSPTSPTKKIETGTDIITEPITGITTDTDTDISTNNSGFPYTGQIIVPISVFIILFVMMFVIKLTSKKQKK